MSYDYITIDEGKAKNFTIKQKRELIKELQAIEVNKRCEACGFYANTNKDVMAHASMSRHGFSNQGYTVWVGML